MYPPWQCRCWCWPSADPRAALFLVAVARLIAVSCTAVQAIGAVAANESVITVTAKENVVAVATVDDVIAVDPPDCIGSVITEENVGVVRPRKIFDLNVSIPRGNAGVGAGQLQVGPQPRRCIAVISPVVVSCAAVQSVGAPAANENVISIAAN